MKRVIKVISAILLVSVLLLMFGELLDISELKMGRTILVGTIAIIAAGLTDSRQAKNQKRHQEIEKTMGCRPIGFIRTPLRMQTQAFMLILMLLTILGLIIVAGFLCYQDGALKGEALFYMNLCIIVAIASILFLGVWINKMKQEIGYHENGVILYKKQGIMLSWREFGIYEKRGKWVSFYSRNGEKLFMTKETDEGYPEFWKLFQMNVEGLMPHTKNTFPPLA